MKYLDTSVVISLYLKDNFSEKISYVLSKELEYPFISPWVVVEFKSALSLLVRKKLISRAIAKITFEHFQNDKSQAKYSIQAIRKEHFELAVSNLNFDNSLRAADSLHLAIAQLEQLELVTSDKILAKTAKQFKQSVLLIKA